MHPDRISGRAAAAKQAAIAFKRTVSGRAGSDEGFDIGTPDVACGAEGIPSFAAEVWFPELLPAPDNAPF